MRAFSPELMTCASISKQAVVRYKWALLASVDRKSDQESVNDKQGHGLTFPASKECNNLQAAIVVSGGKEGFINLN